MGVQASAYEAVSVGGGEKEIVLSRVFDSPRERVWEAFTKPERVVKWWGPVGFTTTTQKHELKVGGVWRFVMHGPDGKDYENLITYLEVDGPRTLRYKHGGDADVEPVNFEVKVGFEEVEGGKKTKVTLQMVFESKASKEFVVNTYGAVEGGKQTLTRLAEYLGAGEEGDDAFVIMRVFDVPVETMYRAWTKKEALAKWFGPKGSEITHCTLDMRPGGVFHYCMKHPMGMDMWGKWEIREVVENERIVCVSSFSDEEGGVTRASFLENWPLRLLMRVTFVPHAGIGRGTVVRVEWKPLDATKEELAAFAGMHESMQGGWGGTLERLGEFVGTAAKMPA